MFLRNRADAVLLFFSHPLRIIRHRSVVPKGTCERKTQMAFEESPARAGTATSRRSQRGFAAMDPQRQREIASLGGRAAHQSGHAHEFTTEEARAAGRKRHAKGNGGAGSARSERP